MELNQKEIKMFNNLTLGCCCHYRVNRRHQRNLRDSKYARRYGNKNKEIIQFNRCTLQTQVRQRKAIQSYRDVCNL